MQTDIIIIGLGISAKLMALSLGLHEFKVTLIPNQNIKNNTSNLVTFFSSGSIKFLSNILNDDKSIRCYEDIKQLCCSQYDQLNKKNFINIVDPYLILMDYPINNESRYKGTFIIGLFYFCTIILILYIRLKWIHLIKN